MIRAVDPLAAIRRIAAQGAVCLLLGSLCWPVTSLAGAMPAVALGSRLYHEGLGSDGRPLQAKVQGDVPLPTAAVACVQCHRRSGLGVAEGGQRSAPIDAYHLFAAVDGPDARPAYSEASLLAAVNGGISAGGRKLSPLMPRYRLSAKEVSALAAYLRLLGQDTAPGVTPEEITIATVIADSAPAAERAATRRVLERFVAARNADTRHESVRAERARKHPWGDRADRYWRHWRLQLWELHGEPTTWPAQLERHQRQDPVFAVVGGTAGRDWGTVHGFCEAQHLPCLLPLTSTLPDHHDGWYSLYFNEGVALEARTTVEAIAGSAEAGRDTRVLVVHDDSPAGLTAWRAILAAWPGDGRAAPVERVVSRNRTLRAAEWQALLGDSANGILVAWVDPAHLSALLEPSVMPFLPERIYTAETFTDLQSIPAADRWRERLRHIYPWRVPRDTAQPFPREQAWLRANGLADLDPRLAGRALFACHVFGEALGNLHGNFSQDYLMEGLEHMLDGSDMTTLLPRTSLGPGQRVLSRGAYVLAFAAAGTYAPPPVWLE